MIKLKSLLPEGIHLPPPTVSFVSPSNSHAYNKPAADHVSKHYYQSNINFSGENENDSRLVEQSANIISRFENNINYKRGGYNKSLRKWFPMRSLEGGAKTIAYGHKILKGENFNDGITETEARDILRNDINLKIEFLKRKIPNFDTLPHTVKIAAINAAFRGDLGPKTMRLLNDNQFKKAAIEYLNNREFRTTHNRGVKKRMEWNAKIFNDAS